MNEEHQPPIWLEISAALLVPAACVGFSRVFIERSTILPIIGAALLSSAVAVLARRFRVPLVLSTLLSVALLTVLIANRYAPDTSRFGVVPTRETFEQLRLVFDELLRNFQELKTPVPALQPFVAAAMVGAWVMAFLTDWGAMRLRLAFEPVLPSALLFIFTAIPPVSAGGNQVLSSVVFGAAVAAWAVSQRAANLLQRGVWLANDHRRGPARIAAAGSVVAALAVLTGSLVGPSLPGAGADPLYSFQDQGDPTRVVVSPFVNIRSRLVSQTSQELFTVAADRATYWRIAGLDTYEDDIWKVAGDFSPETGRLPGQREYSGEVRAVTQDFSISALAAIWLPAAFAPSEILGASAEVTWNAENSSLTVANNIVTSDGVDYSLLSNVPAFSVEQLQSSTEVIPADIAARYLTLPSNLSPQVRDLANQVTEGSATRYDKMRALQDHFRGYDYNVRLGPRQGDPIEQFLAERQGFCQQFAGTFALMARTLGIPARVATGFTWGDPIGEDESGKTIYRVTGRHTHAWPEIYFDDFGWVAFEPTPGRGLPGATSYTGAAATQDSLIQPTDPDGPITTTTVDPSAQPEVPDLPEIPEFGIDDLETETVTVEQPGFSVPWRLVGVVLAVLAYLVGLPLLWKLRRDARRGKATTPSRRVETAWAEAVEAIELGYDAKRSPSETRSEFAERLDNDRRVSADGLSELAETTNVARFHPAGTTDLMADQADGLAARIEETMKRRVPREVRLRRQLDPRRLLRLRKRVVSTELAIEEVTVSDPSTNGREPVAAASTSDS
jgi:transglutaminase-like putative cysteine protease